MQFVSYSGNLEDVVLRRALMSVEAGFYIDAGAADPVADSVTWAFYQRGWRGINVEPAPQTFRRLSDVRTEDINIRALLGSEPGEGVLYLINGESGFSTMDPQIAAHHHAKGRSCRQITVPVTTLAAVCARHVVGPVHFLKIDVEGAERAVLLGADFGKCRPWIILLEATFPGTEEPTHEPWEPVLLGANYKFVYSDRLNRFYVAEEHLAQLGPAFTVPPSSFDGYITAQEQAAASALASRDLQIAQLEAEVLRLQTELAASRGEALEAKADATASLRRRTAAEVRAHEVAERLAAANRDLEFLQARMTQLSEDKGRLERDGAVLRSVLLSRSWRLTAPFRNMRHWLRPRS